MNWCQMAFWCWHQWIPGSRGADPKI